MKSFRFIKNLRCRRWNHLQPSHEGCAFHHSYACTFNESGGFAWLMCQWMIKILRVIFTSTCLVRSLQQVRTVNSVHPRHIIKMIVELMQPKPTDTICDPACGTAGFLVAASEYLNDHHSTEIFASPEAAKRFSEETFFGYDFDSTMLRIGSMNMMLHGVENPRYWKPWFFKRSTFTYCGSHLVWSLPILHLQAVWTMKAVPRIFKR